jgi:hypothetical protein
VVGQSCEKALGCSKQLVCLQGSGYVELIVAEQIDRRPVFVRPIGAPSEHPLNDN